MQRSRYKFVSNLDHARWFQQGQMFCRAAAYYRHYEDKKALEVIGDQYEGSRRQRSCRERDDDHHRGPLLEGEPARRLDCLA